MKKRVLTAVLTAALVTGTCVATVSAKEEQDLYHRYLPAGTA